MHRPLRRLRIGAVLALCLISLGFNAWAGTQTPAAPSAPAKQGVPTAEEIHKLLDQISQITGMALKHPVPIAVLDKDQWHKWVDERMKETVKPDELKNEETAMKMFGFVPANFDLREATVDLMTEQAAAVYDHKTKRMIIVQGAAPDEMQEAVLIHELSHALADQHFDMHRFLDKGPRSDESESARLAVVEGQAMWIMLEAVMNRTGRSLLHNSAVLELMLPAMRDMAAAQYPVFGKSPLYLKESLMFPYSAGLKFQQATLDKLGRDAFSEVLRNPPLDTHEIIHPEVYLAHEPAAKVELPETGLRDKPKKLIDGDVGEMDVHVLFEQYGSTKDADAVAPAWRAGRFELLEPRGSKRPMLRWALLWDSPESAHKAYGLWLKAVEGKSTGLAWKDRKAEQAEGSNQYGAFRIRQEGARLEGLEGLP